MALSVISRHRRAGSRPETARMSCTSSMRVVRCSCLVERLTLMVRAGASGWASCHSLVWQQASRSTKRPRGTMRPVSSARVMNPPGRTWPIVGWFHRTSASVPVIRPVVTEKTGW